MNRFALLPCFLLLATLLVASLSFPLWARGPAGPRGTPGLPGYSEDYYNDQFCARVHGEREIRHEFTYEGGRGYIVVDCETEYTVYEGGLDKRSSLDSVQQALFAAEVTGKSPAIAIYDTDGKLGSYEHRIGKAARRAAVMFTRVNVSNPN